MEESKELRMAILKIIQNQINENNPPETKHTYDRLLALGKRKNDVMNLIGCVVSIEIFEVLKNNGTFNNERYINNLSNLPKLPF